MFDASPTPPPSASPKSSSRPSRQAAQKASEVIASYQEKLPAHIMGDEDLLKEALKPMKDEEKDDHKAWVEMESDPAYFSGVLKDLGVADIKITELLTLSKDEVDELPQPVYGFVFLSQYVGEDQEDTQEAPRDLWFANQTMSNGCATVALINIVMNQSDITLGPTLTAFKAATAPVSPVERGYILDSHSLIRQTHNAFGRRLEHLNADLFLSNEFSDEEGDPDAALAKRNSRLRKNNNKRRGSNTNQPPKKKKRKANSDVCHYKAFIFALDQVWVLDGLEANPVSLGYATADDWTEVALIRMNEHMEEAIGEYFCVLAVCPAPTRRLRAELLSNILELRALRQYVARKSGGSPPPRQPDNLYWDPAETDQIQDDERLLASFGLTREDLTDPIALQKVTPAVKALDEAPDTNTCVEVIRGIEAAQMEIVIEYNTEVMNSEGDLARCKERKQDFGAAIHAWVGKLAAIKALQPLVEDAS